MFVNVRILGVFRKVVYRVIDISRYLVFQALMGGQDTGEICFRNPLTLLPS
jgi:hypothetical protein